MTTRRQWFAPVLTTILAASVTPVRAQAHSQPCRAGAFDWLRSVRLKNCGEVRRVP